MSTHLLAIAMLVAGACGPIASDPHAGEQSATPSTGAYRLWFLAPPWQLIGQTGEQTTLRIVVGPSASAPPSLNGATFELDVDVTATAPGDVLTSMQVDAASRGAMMAYAQRPVMFGDETMGVETAYYDGVVSVRIAAVRLHDGRTAVLRFQSLEPIQDDADVTAMIGQFEPAPMGSH